MGEEQQDSEVGSAWLLQINVGGAALWTGGLHETGSFGEVDGFGPWLGEDLHCPDFILLRNLQSQTAKGVRNSPLHANHILVFEEAGDIR
jgi:hypothetical protein